MKSFSPSAGKQNSKSLFSALLGCWLVLKIANEAIRLTMIFQSVHAGIRPSEIGFIFSFSALITAAATLGAGRAFSRFGPAVLVTGSISLMTIGGLILAFCPPRPEVLTILILASSVRTLGWMLANTTIQRTAGMLFAGDQRTRAFSTITTLEGLFDIATPLGMASMFLLFPEGTAYAIFGLSACLGFIGLAVPGVIALRCSEVKKRISFRDSFSRIGASSPLKRAVAIGVAAHVMISCFSLLIPMASNLLDLSQSRMGIILSVFAAAECSAAFLISLKFIVPEPWKSVRIGLLMTGFSLLLMSTQPQFGILLVLTFCAGFGLGIVMPFIMTLIYRYAEPGFVGDVVSSRLLLNNLGRIVAPILFGWGVEYLSASIVFWIGISIVLLSLLAFSDAS